MSGKPGMHKPVHLSAYASHLEEWAPDQPLPGRPVDLPDWYREDARRRAYERAHANRRSPEELDLMYRRYLQFCLNSLLREARRTGLLATEGCAESQEAGSGSRRQI